MELELKRSSLPVIRRYRASARTARETTETIVPDYLPDIARIVDASGAFSCAPVRDRRRKSAGVGHGPHDALYVAEDAQGMKSFEYTPPLDETIEGARAERQRGQSPRRPALLVRSAHAQSA